MKDNNLNTNQEVSKDEKKGGFFKKDSKAEKLHAENLELKNDLQRTRADFENYRKNVESRVSNAQNLGEAIQFDEDSEGEEEVILAELRAGYTLKGEVLRAAMVKVGRK